MNYELGLKSHLLFYFITHFDYPSLSSAYMLCRWALHDKQGGGDSK